MVGNPEVIRGALAFSGGLRVLRGFCYTLLVAQSMCAKWSEADSRRKQCSRMSLSEAREFFSRQATELSKDGYWIRSYVLDVALS
jgi:hypothetical protein